MSDNFLHLTRQTKEIISKYGEHSEVAQAVLMRWSEYLQILLDDIVNGRETDMHKLFQTLTAGIHDEQA